MKEFETLLPKDIRRIIEKLQTLLEKEEKSKSIISDVIINEQEQIHCPCCESTNIVKDGKYKGRQKYKCKDCNKKFNSLTNTPFHHTRLTYNQIEKAYECLVNKLSIRKSAEKIGVSTKTAFVLRFKLINALKESRNNTKLTGDMQIDEYYLSINLKGTKPENMPRKSKPRKTHGTGTRGISKHKVCVLSGKDSLDSIVFEVAGVGNVTSNMIKEYLVPKIEKPNKVITDCKSSYESVAIDYNWNLKQVKSSGYIDDEGNNLAEINGLHSELTLFLSQFHGVSTKHLQEYLDWFAFDKYLNYGFKYLDQPEEFEKNTITKKTEIIYNNVCDNHSILDFKEIYVDYNYHPSNSTT